MRPFVFCVGVQRVPRVGAIISFRLLHASAHPDVAVLPKSQLDTAKSRGLLPVKLVDTIHDHQETKNEITATSAADVPGTNQKGYIQFVNRAFKL